MLTGKPRFFFSARHKTGGRILHIISAHSIGRARASLGRLSEEYTFEQLTWADMNRLAGFAPPTTDAATTFASGGLMWEWQRKVVMLEVAD